MAGVSTGQAPIAINEPVLGDGPDASTSTLMKISFSGTRESCRTAGGARRPYPPPSRDVRRNASGAIVEPRSTPLATTWNLVTTRYTRGHGGGGHARQTAAHRGRRQ